MSELSRQYHSLIISGENTWDRWHLVPSTRPLVNPPEVEENYIKIAGKDGFLDLSELLAGRPIYGKRTGSWEFIVHPDFAWHEPWDIKYSEIMHFLHGKTHKVILEDDPTYYYEGRLKVNNWKSDKDWSTITIDYTLQSYKRSVNEIGSEEWLWDPFDFENDVIEDSSKELVDDYLVVSVDGSQEPVVPKIIVEYYEDQGGTMVPVIDDPQPISVTFEDETYALSEGENRVSQIVLADGVNTFEFTGRGRVSIVFRRGWL